MGGADTRRSYATLKYWHRHASTRAPNTSWTDMEKAKGDFQTLYQRKKPHPPGLSLDTHVNSDKVNNEVLSYTEV